MYDVYNAHMPRVKDIRNECLKQQKVYGPISRSKPNKFRYFWHRKQQRKIA
ncbi:hypothetical protein [Piscibacillus halophilus]|uniref:Uncharacterized protein n=1 Tax=Piscibacillus halophilus TaxID=571933 RepID=A0A1H9DJE0_9BACI|nr:hypothetical protein [Piscibacillus halophilus]SEQ13622.1 hypothetical protein SAMN05216362_10736 [Piscibacillus halophilus]